MKSMSCCCCPRTVLLHTGVTCHVFRTRYTGHSPTVFTSNTLPLIPTHLTARPLHAATARALRRSKHATLATTHCLHKAKFTTPPKAILTSQATTMSRKSAAGLATAPCLGVIRIDYDYPPSPGDIDSPDSYGYDVFYRVVPGLTFEVCKGITTEVVNGVTELKGVEKQVLDDFIAAIKYLDEEKKVYGSTRLAPRTRLASTH